MRLTRRTAASSGGRAFKGGEDPGACLPNLVIIGAAKCGTTSLHSYLGKHPDVFSTQQKELHFFISGEPWATWERGLDWYKRHFEGGAFHAVRVESSPGYSFDQYASDVARRMSRLIPDTRIVYLIRDPIERIKSHYIEELYGHRVPPEIPLEAIIRAGPEDPGPKGHFYDRLVNTSMYMCQLEKYWRYFERDRILLIVTEELASDPKREVGRVFEFLGLDPEVNARDVEVRLNPRSEKRLRVRDPIKILRRCPGYGALSNAFPITIKVLYRHMVGEKLDDERVTWLSEGSLQHLRDLIGPDVARLRGATGLALREWSV